MHNSLTLLYQEPLIPRQVSPTVSSIQANYDLFPADEHARTLEEQWIESIESGNANFDAGISNTSMNPILLGLICGFFFPLLPLFFFKDSLAPYTWANGAPVTSQPTVIFG